MVGPNGVPNGNNDDDMLDLFSDKNTTINPDIETAISTMNDGQITSAKEMLFNFMTVNRFNELFRNVSTIQGLLTAITTHNERVSSGTGGSGPNGNGNGPTFGSEKIYTPFEPTDIVTANKTTVTSGLFSNGAATLTSHFSASLLGDTSASYVEIYNADPDSDSTAQV